MRSVISDKYHSLKTSAAAEVTKVVFVTRLVWVPLKLGYFLPHCCSTKPFDKKSQSKNSQESLVLLQ